MNETRRRGGAVTVRQLTFAHKGYRAERTCPRHYDTPQELWFTAGPAVLLPRPHVFWAGTWVIVDEAGEPVCDRCACEGLRAGVADLTNPAELEDYPSSAGDIMDLRWAAADWGGIPLEMLGRALDAAERRGALPAIAARLVAAAKKPPQGPTQGVGAAPDGALAEERRARTGRGVPSAGPGPADDVRPPPAAGRRHAVPSPEVGGCS